MKKNCNEKQTKEKKYSKQFKYPEMFFKINDQIRGIAYNPNKNKDYER